MASPLVVVFDTSVVIPLALPSGRSASMRLLSRLRNAGHLVAISPQIRAEVRDKMLHKRSLRKWLRIASADEIEQFVHRLPAMLGHAELTGNIIVRNAVRADPDDDKIIAAAVEANAAYVVTEDPHLLDLGQWQGIKILNRAAFDAELDRLGVPR